MAVVAVSTAAADPSLREVPEDVVDEILLRLPCPSSLARAAAASASFRALVSSPRFLRRHRALHPDAASGPFLGVFCSVSASTLPGGAFHPAESPHPAAAAARAVAAAADFSFSFLPDAPDGWIVRDYRDGRFLLDRPSESTSSKVFTDLAVCDPVSRRYVLLPPIPEELATTVDNPLGVLGGQRRCEPFLAPDSSSSSSEEPEPSFVVIWTGRCPRKVVAFAFSSRDGEWRVVPSPECFVWRSRRSPFACPVHAVWNRRHYAHGRFYWVDCLANRWLVLDTTTMELQVEEVPSPARYWEENVAVVEGAEGAVGVFAHDFYHADGKASLNYYTILRDDADGGSGAASWRLDKTIPLPWPSTHGRPYCIRNAGNGCLIIEVTQDSPRPFFSGQCSRDVELFKIDVERFRLERVCKARCAGGAGDGYWPYFGFPPLLALPTV
ncbi:uncharacterized protein LOC100827484 [Brachypodium distachyon]|uniref:F-box domain-containing protein n=1 Tax=Brachypodium distachyon TaxID=15368 RepID=I1HYG0_BRADI|nr:uncharacterized protein LOC100827484 [Brachypodium distachyon]KQJ93898.1 hypothetical protein BRADI_3g07340v3 [Brachypodium distachyon]|eukprot:XP_003571079.1 uncharacterized protein LOC100827484 [Brachypodium distachyon]